MASRRCRAALAFVFTVRYLIATDAQPNPLCFATGPCKCYDDDTRIVCHGQPLEEWWNPFIYGPHTYVTSLAIMATSLNQPITSLKNFPNLRDLEVHQTFKDNLCRNIFEDNIFSDVQLSMSLTNVKFVDVGIMCQIPAAMQRLHNLKRLEFRRTNLRVLDENVFRNFPNLEELILAESLTDFGRRFDLPPNLFSNLHRLTVLSLESNENVRIRRDTLNGLESHLIDLNLKKCNLRDDIFAEIDQLTNLESLDLSENAITLGAYSNPFRTHPNLKRLNLGSNRGIKRLDPEIFVANRNLVELDVTGADISVFDLSFLKYTPNLRFIDGSENFANLFHIIYPFASEERTHQVKLHFCKNIVGFFDSNLREMLEQGGELNITESTQIICDLGEHRWMAELVQCNKKHGLIYSQGTKCVGGEEDSFAFFLQAPAVCKGVLNSPSTLVITLIALLLAVKVEL